MCLKYKKGTRKEATRLLTAMGYQFKSTYQCTRELLEALSNKEMLRIPAGLRIRVVVLLCSHGGPSVGNNCGVDAARKALEDWLDALTTEGDSVA